MDLTEKQAQVLFFLGEYFKLKGSGAKPARHRQIATLLLRAQGTQGAPSTAVPHDRARRSVAATLGQLEQKGYVEGDDYTNGYSTYKRWRLTDRGEEFLGLATTAQTEG